MNKQARTLVELLQVPRDIADSMTESDRKRLMEIAIETADWSDIAMIGTTALATLLSRLEVNPDTNPDVQGSVLAITSLFITLGIKPPTPDADIFLARYFQTLDNPGAYLKMVIDQKTDRSEKQYELLAALRKGRRRRR